MPVVEVNSLVYFRHRRTPQEAADTLVELALRSGGPDNVTVVVAEVVEATEGDAAAETRAVVKAAVEGRDAAIGAELTRLGRSGVPV